MSSVATESELGASAGFGVSAGFDVALGFGVSVGLASLGLVLVVFVSSSGSRGDLERSPDNRIGPVASLHATADTAPDSSYAA